MNVEVNIVNELLKINDNSNYPIDGRELHRMLGVETPYDKWFPRMCDYGFEEGADFSTKMSESTGGRPARQHSLTLSMAKEICMLQRTELGRQVRRYLIDVENSWNSPEQVMARALRVADETISKLTGQVKLLEVDNAQLTVDNQRMLPKAEYFDELVDRNLLTNFRETAKELKIKERAFVGFLLDKKYIYRDRKGKLMPYESKNNGLFEVKECTNDKTAWSGTQTLITPKGRETFRLLTQGLEG